MKILLEKHHDEEKKDKGLDYQQPPEGRHETTKYENSIIRIIEFLGSTIHAEAENYSHIQMFQNDQWPLSVAASDRSSEAQLSQYHPSKESNGLSSVSLLSKTPTNESVSDSVEEQSSPNQNTDELEDTEIKSYKFI